MDRVHHRAIGLILFAFLSGCGLSLPGSDETAEAPPPANERPDVANDPTAELSADGGLTGESASLVATADIQTAEAPRENATSTGFLAGLFGGGNAQKSVIEPPPVARASDVADADADGADVIELAVSDAVAEVKSADAAQAAPAPRGFFSSLFARRAPDQALEVMDDTANEALADAEGASAPDTADAVALASASEPALEKRKAGTTAPRRGLLGGFGLFQRRSDAPAPSELAARYTDEATGGAQGGLPTTLPASSEPDVAAGAPLAFGQVGRVCGLRGRGLGKRVARFPERGQSGFALYDTEPGSIDARAFYITGFDDGCARQITAANAIFGAPSMHERLRYGLPSNTLPTSETDVAYKRLKSRICKVPRNQPCSPSGIKRIERNTVFVTLYESFSDNNRWSNVLLHEGALFASDIKQAR
ncbi:MAG: hypothetical protein MK098_02655 [Marinovum sp.]|nr:hypothetical protein [Marinovum sp.]